MNNTKAKKSAIFCTGSAVPQRILRKCRKPSEGAKANRQILEEDRHTLEEAYRTGGVEKVKAVFGLQKTAAYELVAAAGLRKEKIKRENKIRNLTFGRKRRQKRLDHLFDHYGWTPGMNCCFLTSLIKVYEKPIEIAGKAIYAGIPVCVAALPRLNVRDFMKLDGLKYYVTKAGVVSVEEIRDDCRNIILRMNKRHLRDVPPSEPRPE